MALLSIILGIILVIAGIACICTPLVTFLATGYFLAILLMVYGISGIARFISKRAGVLDLVISILAIIVGFVAATRPGSAEAFDSLILILIGVWVILQGIVSIILAFQARKMGASWIFGLVVGILAIIIGILSFTHPILTAITVGILVAFYFIEAGISMIVLGAAAGAAASAASDI